MLLPSTRYPASRLPFDLPRKKIEGDSTCRVITQIFIGRIILLCNKRVLRKLLWKGREGLILRGFVLNTCIPTAWVNPVSYPVYSSYPYPHPPGPLPSLFTIYSFAWLASLGLNVLFHIIFILLIVKVFLAMTPLLALLEILI